MTGAQLVRGEPAQRLEVIEMIAESEDLLRCERGDEDDEGDDEDEGEREAMTHEGRRQKAEVRKLLLLPSAFCPLPSAFISSRRNLSRLSSSVACPPQKTACESARRRRARCPRRSSSP